jgi:NAD(P)-dependent dehydrogenase (short-subunit alcohol dehydrogenase family)
MNTALITGTSRGIGLEFARQYAEDGWRVIACTRSPEKSDALNGLAARYAERVAVHALDVTNHARIDELARSLSGVTIDLLINNAGIYTDSHAAALDQIDYDGWALSFRVNTMATLKMAQAFLPHIKGSRQKKIVTISSKMGSIAENTSGGNYSYRSSKAAVNMVVKSLSIDLRPAGIIATVFHPGWVKTDMGGPRALISVTESVSGMRRVIDRLSMADSGTFLAYDGRPVQW